MHFTACLHSLQNRQPPAPGQQQQQQVLVIRLAVHVPHGALVHGLRPRSGPAAITVVNVLHPGRYGSGMGALHPGRYGSGGVRGEHRGGEQVVAAISVPEQEAAAAAVPELERQALELKTSGGAAFRLVRPRKGEELPFEPTRFMLKEVVRLLG